MQIPKIMFLNALNTMKKTLDLLEFKLQKDTPDFKYMKQQLMNFTYDGLKKTFKLLEQKKLVKKCTCGNKMRQGYASCPNCAGSEYTNI